MDEAQVLDILGAYGLGRVRKAEPLDFPFRPWRVTADTGVFVLRPCYLNVTPRDLAFEHGLAEWLGQRGLPVALPCRTTDGATYVERGAGLFALFPCMPGAPFEVRNAQQAAGAGAMLARFHDEASRVEGAQDRGLPDAFRTPQRNVAAIRESWGRRPETEGLIEDFEELDWAVSQLGLGEALLHNDFTPGNCVFDGDEVRGLFDLDCCCWGPRMLDVANSLMHFAFVETGQEGVAEHQDEFDLPCAESFLRGYESAYPLPAAEKEHLPLILRRRVRAWMLRDLAEIAELGAWRPWEWRVSAMVIALIDGVSEHLAGG
jgi:Ser/Thr protein kinase RdoA (MazF antagonist)